MDKILRRIKEQFKNLEDKKIIGYLIVILISASLILTFLKGISPKEQKDIKGVIKEDSTEYNSEVRVEDYAGILEKKLVHILKKLEGVGEVSVMLTLEDSSEKIPAANTTKSRESTKETDAEGGIREITREDESKQLLNSSDNIVVLKEIRPNIKGVIVIAEGAENAEILEKIYLAVQTVLGLTTNKVQVFSSK
ncbi:hypothetical protein [Tissierella creatinophila]|uniref:Stage III sporulation protein AG n=1 Tax=Tissierella creatinophila DSM 6911 TaxID=1123403 RepID=A0A1U7M9Q9_TISCR|nr:hypothetical protein [Tissierella creatinophila]OLS03938.1 hypothetical protein TICRE_00650 [Tissierella creatinophila DSM 6911]